MPPPPRADSRALFSFHPVLPRFNGQKLCPLPHCGDTNVHSPQGLPRCSTAQGERQGLLQRADCVLGPRERAGPGQGRAGANLSPAGQQKGGKGRAGRGPQARGEGAVPPGWAPRLTAPLGKRGIVDATRVQPGPVGEDLYKGWRGPPSSPGGVGSQPQLTFKGCKFFRQVLFITVLLVTEELLQRREDITEQGVSRQNSPTHRPTARCLLSRQVAGLGRAGQC